MRRRLSISTPCFFAETGNLFWEWRSPRGKRRSPTDNAVERGLIDGCLAAHFARLLRQPGDVFQMQHSENRPFHQCCIRRIPFGSGRAFEGSPESGPCFYGDWTFRQGFRIGPAWALRRLFAKKGKIFRKQRRPNGGSLLPKKSVIFRWRHSWTAPGRRGRSRRSPSRTCWASRNPRSFRPGRDNIFRKFPDRAGIPW